MKKFFLFLMLAAFTQGMTTVSQAAKEQVEVNVHFNDPVGPYPVPRTPTWLPDVYIDGYTLSFSNLWGDYTLTLYDENDVLVYSVFVPAGTTQVVLPATLSGNFEIRFETATYYYYGYISL